MCGQGFRHGRTFTVKAVTDLPFRQTEFLEKKFKKPLDKPHKVWYNLNVIKGRKTLKNQKGIDTMEKLTYSKALDVAIAAVAEGEVRDKLVALKASLEKKNSAERKPTATQTANEGFKEAILAGITEDGKYTITDLIKTVPEISELSNQRVSAIVRQMVETGSLVREEIKRKAYFSLPVE